MERVLVTIMIVLLIGIKFTIGLAVERNETFSCYQCNSALEEKCSYLGLLSKEERRSFYKECPIEDMYGNVIDERKFCRKIDIYSK